MNRDRTQPDRAPTRSRSSACSIPACSRCNPVGRL